MVITTTHNIGDVVYYIFKNKIKETIITGFQISSKEDGIVRETYSVKDNDYYPIDLKNIFKSKEELLKSL